MTDLIGIPKNPGPQDGIAMPLMRGFACPVKAPFMGKEGPGEGIGVGWSNVTGHGVQFFVSVHAEGGFALVARLDPARYLRLAELFASIGQQALITGNTDEVAPNDPLKALAEADEMLREIEEEPWKGDSADRIRRTRKLIAEALMTEDKTDG